jgi:hypothetical protein
MGPCGTESRHAISAFPFVTRLEGGGLLFIPTTEVSDSVGVLGLLPAKKQGVVIRTAEGRASKLYSTS